MAIIYHSCYCCSNLSLFIKALCSYFHDFFDIGLNHANDSPFTNLFVELTLIFSDGRHVEKYSWRINLVDLDAILSKLDGIVSLVDSLLQMGNVTGDDRNHLILGWDIETDPASIDGSSTE